MTKTAINSKGKYNDNNDYAPGLSVMYSTMYSVMYSTMYSIMYSAVRRLAGIGLSIQRPPT